MKKIKWIICSLFLIPCIFLLSACSATISSIEYAKLVKKSGASFYSTFGKSDLTATRKNKIVETELREVSYQQGNSSIGQDCTFVTTTEIEEEITIDSVLTSTFGKTVNIKLVQSVKVTEKGKRAKTAPETGLEDYTSITETTTINYLMTIINGLSESFKLFTEKVVKQDGILNEVQSGRTVYTYTSSSAYSVKVESLIDAVNDEYFRDFFNIETEMLLIGGTCYKDGNAFGLKVEYAETSFEDEGEYDYVEIKSDCKFSGNKPSKSVLRQVMENGDKFGVESKSEISKEISASYSDVNILVDGFSDATVVYTNPGINLL